jgi:PAS domain S-box-containing protein
LNRTAEYKSAQELQQEIEDLRYRLQVAEETIEAIRTGSIDALAVQDNGETKIFILEGAEKTYRVLVENMREGAVTLNRQGIILYSNAQFANLLHLPLSAVIGASFLQFIAPEYQGHFQDISVQAWKQHTKSEFILQPQQGDPVHVYISLTTIVDQEEQVLGMIITNLSEQKELERITEMKDELSRKNDELIRINYDLDTFVYTASHDLKTPVLNIEGLVTALAEALEEGSSPGEVNQIIQMIGGSVTHFKSTLLNLTEISKLQKNFTGLTEKINCKHIIQEVIAGFTGLISQSEAQVTLDICDQQELQFSKKNFQSIIYNLLSNALKYRAFDRKSKIHIAMELRGDFILLSVGDNGLGINLKNSSKLFSMFERLHDHVEGSGVGLYIVKRIMDNAAGRIEVESEIDRGSTFKLYFKV